MSAHRLLVAIHIRRVGVRDVTADGLCFRHHLVRFLHLLTTTPTMTGDAAFASGVSRLLARPLVRGAFLMGGLAPLACNLTLLGAVHRSKSAVFLGHFFPSSLGRLEADSMRFVVLHLTCCNGNATPSQGLKPEEKTDCEISHGNEGLKWRRCSVTRCPIVRVIAGRTSTEVRLAFLY